MKQAETLYSLRKLETTCLWIEMYRFEIYMSSSTAFNSESGSCLSIAGIFRPFRESKFILAINGSLYGILMALSQNLFDYDSERTDRSLLQAIDAEATKALVRENVNDFQ